MKFTIDRRELADSLKWVTSALAKRPNTPAMGGVRVTVAEDAVTLTAWDYTAAHTARLSTIGAEPGEILVPGSTLAQLVAAMRGRDVSLADEGADLTVKCGASSYKLRTLPLGDFTAPPKPPKQIGSVSGAALAEVVDAVEWAAARDDIYPALMQVRLEADGDTLTAIATDRFMFAVDKCAYDGAELEAGVMAGMLVAAVRGLAGETSLGIGLSDSLLSIIGTERTVSLRLVAEKFITWRSVVGIDLPETLTINAGEFADAAKRVASLAEKEQPVAVVLAEDAITLSAHGEAGEGYDVLDGTSTAAHEANFDATRLVKSLSVFDGAIQAHFALVHPPKPWIFDSPTNPGRLTLVMPRRNLR